jgi:GntR family transcriptional repressor for pyruvate dehydrogenase complex
LYDHLITALSSPSAVRDAASLQPQPLVVDRLSDRLAALLGAQIESGALRAGDRLPTEQQLATAHGVSRTVVREAVHQLKSRALVQSRQGSGVFVAPPPVNQALAFDPAVLTSVQAVVHVVEVRRVLEGEIAALAAERATRSQIAALRRALEAIDSAVAEGRDGVAEDLAFHRVIGESTGNPQFRLLLGFLEQYLREGMRITRGNEARRADFMTAVQREHRAIFEAIAAHDPVAARLHANEHLVRGEQRLVEGGIIDGRRRQAAARVARAARPAPDRKAKH